MANPPRKKGTGGEREVLEKARAYGLNAERTAASSKFDIRVLGGTGKNIPVLATRVDHGQWLATCTLDDILHLLASHGDGAHIEVKRYKAMALHTLWKGKFA